MFQSLKTLNPRNEKFFDMDLKSSDRGFHKSPGVNYSVVKGNETRLRHCVNCGFVCDTERDVRMPEDSWARLGISYSGPFTAGSALSDTRNLTTGVIQRDRYYTRTVRGGCPSCGSFIYDKKPKTEGLM